MQEFGSGLTEADVPPEKDVGELMSEIAELASDGSSGEPPSAAKEQEDDGASGLQDESLLRDFIVEGLEYINEIEVNILNLEQNPEDKDCVNAVFRPFHSIKGVAGFLNLDDIRELAHRLEDLLDKIRKDELSVNTDVIDVILEGADALKALIASLQKNWTDIRRGSRGRPGGACREDRRCGRRKSRGRRGSRDSAISWWKTE